MEGETRTDEENDMRGFEDEKEEQDAEEEIHASAFFASLLSLMLVLPVDLFSAPGAEVRALLTLVTDDGNATPVDIDEDEDDID